MWPGITWQSVAFQKKILHCVSQNSAYYDLEEVTRKTKFLRGEVKVAVQTSSEKYPF